MAALFGSVQILQLRPTLLVSTALPFRSFLTIGLRDSQFGILGNQLLNRWISFHLEVREGCDAPCDT